MTMIEKIARAIAEKHWPKDQIDKRYVVYMPAAKAALEAMKEPNEGMIEAGKTYQLNNEDEASNDNQS